MSRRRIVVVGAGTSGAVLAMSLAGRTDHEIIVVESGQYTGLDNESRFMNVLADSSLQSLHDAQLVANGPIVPYVQAHCLGGGSAINGMLLTSEIPDVAHGLISYPDEKDLGEVGRALLNAGGEKSQLWWNHGRWNPARALMHLADEGRIRIASDQVEAVIRSDSGRMTGVRMMSETIESDVVVMCAGAISTPRILFNSGFSAVNSQIGRGLQDHPAITFAIQLRQTSDAFFDAGVVRRGTTSTGEHYVIVAYERASWSESELGLVSVIMLTPHSRGWISDGDDKCRIQMNMLDDERDVLSMREAVLALLHTVSQESFSAIAHNIYADDEGTSVVDLRALSTSDLDTWIRMNLRPVSHVTSSCSQAVDSNGALQSVNDVFVADASVLARVPPSTPAGPVTIEARRIARILEGVLS
jgi:choline dehydrogenase-like flavoprotein